MYVYVHIAIIIIAVLVSFNEIVHSELMVIIYCPIYGT